MSNDDRILRPRRRQNVSPPAFSAQRTPGMAGNDPDIQRMMGLLRDIRAEVQNLQTTLDEAQEKAQLEDEAVRRSEVIALIRARQPIYDYNGQQISQRLRELRTMLLTNPNLYDRFGDEITHIENRWERVTLVWPVAPETATLAPETTTLTPETGTPDDPSTIATDAVEGEETALLPPDQPAINEIVTNVLRQAGEVAEHLQQIIYHVGLLTVPRRLNQHLEQLRIGQTLDFDEAFADEIPNHADRKRILEYLQSRPNTIANGIIDAEHHIVYHASPNPARRRISYLYILLVVAVGAIIAWGFAWVEGQFDLTDWPVTASDSTDMLLAYAFVIVGGFIHIGVDWLKYARSGSGGSLFGLEDWLLWIHIKETGIILGVVSMWVGYFGLVVSTGATLNWQTAFLVGYSIDSFIDLFLQRFSAKTSASVTAITGQLSGE